MLIAVLLYYEYYAQYKSCTGDQLFNTPPPASKQVSVEEKVSINPSMLLQRVGYGIWTRSPNLMWWWYLIVTYQAGFYGRTVSVTINGMIQQAGIDLTSFDHGRTEVMTHGHLESVKWMMLGSYHYEGIYDGKNACFRVSRTTKSCLSVCYKCYSVYFFL